MKKQFRGSGVAQRLYDAALDHVKRQPWNTSDNPALVLITSEYQLAAIRFYKRRGFYEHSVIQHYYMIFYAFVLPIFS